MRRIIRNAVGLGYRPAEVREMMPRDWLLIVAGHNEVARAGKPGASAPSMAEVQRLVEEYG